jgi:uncharacterized protein YkwD
MSPVSVSPILRTVVAAVALAAAVLLAGSVSTSTARGSGCGKTGVASKRSDRIALRDARAAVKCLINEERTADNLKLSGDLSEAAQAHTRYMYRHGCFSHQCPGEADTTQRIRESGYMAGASSYRVGEVIALNRDRATPREVVRQWKNSASHRAEILSSSYRHMGVGMIARHGHAFYTVTLGWKSG